MCIHKLIIERHKAVTHEFQNVDKARLIIK